MNTAKLAATVLALVSSAAFACGSTDAPSSPGSQIEEGLTGGASVNGANIPAVPELVDASLHTWTVNGGVIYENGKTAGYSANVIGLLYFDGVIYQENASKLWWSWNGTTWMGASDPRKPSANGANIPATSALVDAAHDVFVVLAGVVYENGAKAGYTANVAELEYEGGFVYQKNTSSNWWKWTGATWTATGNPNPTPTPPPTTPPPPPTTPPPSPPPPNGSLWVYRNGDFNWPRNNDYSYAITDNYTDTSGSPLTGAYDVKVTSQAWGGWQPAAGVPLTQTNWDQNITGLKHFTFALKPAKSGQSWHLFFHKVGDVNVFDASGNVEYVDVTTAAYGPTAPKANEWSTYVVPVSDVLTDWSAGGVPGKGPPTILTHVYKFAIADSTGTDQTWYVDNVGFIP